MFTDKEIFGMPASNEKETISDYWCTRHGLYVHHSFVSRVLGNAKESDNSDIRGSSYITIPKNRIMTDAEIVNEYLGGIDFARKNAFKANQIRTYLDNQWYGEEGDLLTNYHANIFPCSYKGELIIVQVSRLADDRKERWGVIAEHPGGHGPWSPGRRIFRNNHQTSII